MATSTKIKGNALTFTVDGTDYFCDLTSVVLGNEESDSDVITFCDAATGGTQQYFFTVTAVQSGDPTSFWRFLWDTPADTEVAFIYTPWGNVTPTTSEPHFTGTVITPAARPEIGGEASISKTNAFTFETRLDIVDVPVLDDGSSS